MRYLKYIVSIVLVISLALLMDSCSGGSKQQPKNEPMFNDADSVVVNELTDMFMNKLKNKEYDTALSLLHNIGPDQLEVIDEEEKNQLKEYFAAFPVLNYNLKSTEWVNVYEVSYIYTFEFFEKEEGSEIPNTMNLTLKPMKISDSWFLTLEKKSVIK